MTSSGPTDDEYAEMVREILFAEPIRGVPTQPTRLLDHVYIGSQSNAESLKLLRSLNITHVLNCAGYKGPRPSPNASPYEGLGIDYYEFQAEDTDRYDICQHFPEAFPYLDRVKRDGGVALVHCALGINRSGAVCLGYIMSHCRMPLLQATKFLKDRRRVVLANKYFHRLLVRYARSRGLLDHVISGNDVDSLLTGLHRYSKSSGVRSQSAVVPRDYFSNGKTENNYRNEDFNGSGGNHSNGISSHYYINGYGNGYSNGYSNGYNGCNGYNNNHHVTDCTSSSSSIRLNGLCRDLYSRFDRLAESLRSAAAMSKSAAAPSRNIRDVSDSSSSPHVVYRARSHSALPSSHRSSMASSYGTMPRQSWSGGELGIRGSSLTRSGSLRGLTAIGGGRSTSSAARRRPVSYVHVSPNYY